jgi:hypothetical protein
MCTVYEVNCLHCHCEVKRNREHTDYFPCGTGTCKGNGHEHVVLVKEDKYLVHKLGNEEKINERKKEEEWPEMNCKPM